MRLRIPLLILASLFFFTAEAQKTKEKKKTKAKEEEIEKPPPPQEEIKDVRIDTTAEFIASPMNNENAEMSFKLPESTPPPADELTADLRKMMKVTGAMDFGVQFAKLMNSDNEQERNGLPKEFYKRMYDEMSKGEIKERLENEIIKIYRKYLTLEDTKALLAFYETEVGKKTIYLLPKVFEEAHQAGAGIGRVLGMKIYNELVKEGKLK